MAWRVNLGGDKEFELGKLPATKLQEIADAEGVFWWDILNQHPARSLQRFIAVVDACALSAGISPSPSQRIVTGDDFVEAAEGDTAWVTEIADIEDQPMGDGFPTTPESPESGSSSGLSGDSTGLPMSSDDSE